MKHSRLHPGFLAATAAVSAVALYYGTGLNPIWWLTWLAPLPLLLITPRLSPISALVISFLSATAGALNLWSYFRQSLQSPLVTSLLVILVPSAVFALGIMLFRSTILRGSLFRAAMVFPSYFVAYGYLSSMVSPHGTAFNIAYSQMNFLPILQIASITGLWGIGFCVYLFPATVAALCTAAGRAGRKMILAAGVGLLLLAVFGYGGWRLQSHDSATLVRVGLIASDLPQNTLPETREDTLRLLREYAAEADKLSSQRLQVLVLPEKIGVVEEAYLDEADGLLAAAAARAGATLVAGLIRRDQHGLWNEARVYLPGGGPALTYEKHHMLPPFESRFTVGNSLTLLHQASGIWGIAICKDMDFPPLSRQYASEGTGLLLVPAWDFDADGWLHGRMAILRGIESGFSIARAPRHGILSLSDADGRVLAERSTASAPFTSLVAEVPVHYLATLYSRWGDYFAWLCLMICLAAVFTGRRN